MTNQHPITPPPELVQRWYQEADSQLRPYYVYIATQAAQWGADQQLEATDTWIRTEIKGWLRPANRIADDHHADMRPKPPTLKEQALQILDTHGNLTRAEADTIRRALEALPE